MRHRWYPSIIACISVGAFFMLTNVFIGTSSVLPHEGVANTSNKTSTNRRRAKPKKGPGTQKQVNCNDNAPSNAAANKCTLNVNQPFTVNCNLPFNGGASREVDQHCPNQGCTQSPPDITQNLVKNNLCATGSPVEINFESIDRLQRDVDQMVAAHKISYGRRAQPKGAKGPKGPQGDRPSPRIALK